MLKLAVIPASGHEKIPVGKWREFQSGIPQTVHERWYGGNGEQRSNYRMGFLTGAASLRDGWKLLVIDLDEKGSISGSLTWDHWIAENELGCDLETWRARTGGGGQHIYFRYPDHLTIRNTQETIAGIDVRAEGSFVIAPPSRQKNGKPYTWLFSPFETELAETPQWLLEKVGATQVLDVTATGSSPTQASTSSLPAPSAPTLPRQTIATAQATDAWGHIVDGRDAYMRDMIWALIVDWYRECPIRPPDRKAVRRLSTSKTTTDRSDTDRRFCNSTDNAGHAVNISSRARTRQRPTRPHSRQIRSRHACSSPDDIAQGRPIPVNSRRTSAPTALSARQALRRSSSRFPCRS